MRDVVLQIHVKVVGKTYMFDKKLPRETGLAQMLQNEDRELVRQSLEIRCRDTIGVMPWSVQMRVLDLGGDWPTYQFELDYRLKESELPCSPQGVFQRLFIDPPTEEKSLDRELTPRRILDIRSLSRQTRDQLGSSR